MTDAASWAWGLGATTLAVVAIGCCVLARRPPGASRLLARVVNRREEVEAARLAAPGEALPPPRGPIDAVFPDTTPACVVETCTPASDAGAVRAPARGRRPAEGRVSDGRSR